MSDRVRDSLVLGVTGAGLLGLAWSAISKGALVEKSKAIYFRLQPIGMILIGATLLLVAIVNYFR